MEFMNRVSAYPNRYTMTDENGNVSLVTLERADEPVQEGTPLNADTFNALLLCTESKNYPGCYYHTVDGEPEWLNPPMIPNAVQRTTKRFNGYPVYTVATTFDTLAVAGESVTRDFAGGTISKILSLTTTYYPKNDMFNVYSDPFVESDGVYAYTRMMANDVAQTLQIVSVKDMTGYSAVCIVEFMKAEEAL